MKSKLLFLTVVFLIVSGCKSSLVNFALEKKGIYDVKIKPTSFTTEGKQIVFFPMQHIGRKEYYDDVRRKIDSLKDNDFVFFYEKIKDDTTDSLGLYKFRKIIHFGIPKNGYVNLLDSLYKSGLNFKYDLVNQPSVSDFGLTESNSFNVDMTIQTIVSNVEKSKTISLEACDFLNSYTQNYKCKDKFLTTEEWNKYLVADRDALLAKEVKNSKHPKIAIIYGKQHLNGFAEQIQQ